MPEIDVNRILHENPTKHLMIEYGKLCMDYTKENAEKYSEAYKGKPLSFLLENSRYIFSESNYGYSYYRENVLDSKHALTCSRLYKDESDKVRTYLEDLRDYIREHGYEIDSNQEKMYESLIEELDQKYKDTENLRNMMDFIESVYSENEEPEDTKHPAAYFTLAPFLIAEGADTSSEILDRLNELKQICLTESNTTDIDHWKVVFESIVSIGKLKDDPVYMEVVNEYTSPDFKRFVNNLSRESVEDQIRSITSIPIDDAELSYYGTSETAVNRIFEMADTYERYKDEYDQKASEIDLICEYAYGFLEGISTFEYVSNDHSEPNHIGCTDENGNLRTVADTYQFYKSKSSKYMKESEDKDSVGEPSKTVRKSAGYEMEDSPTGKKLNPPVPKTAAKKAQFAFMDKEAKAYKKMAKAKEKGEDIKNAAKAAGAIPLKIKEDINESIQKWDEMDDERRMNYIVKPGFRKKAFRNLKLAMIYGASASYSLLMIPITMIARHYSKQKDRRIRNQLVHEFETEIEICKEKIQDASSNGDNKEKYKLMRIKSKLERERTRVLVNSRYI